MHGRAGVILCLSFLITVFKDRAGETEIWAGGGLTRLLIITPLFRGRVMVFYIRAHTFPPGVPLLKFRPVLKRVLSGFAHKQF